MLSPGHPQAGPVQALLKASHAAKRRYGFSGFGSRSIGMEVVVRPPLVPGDATNSLGGIGDTLQSNRRNIDLTYLGELADAFLYDDDKQIREVHYREESGPAGYSVRFWGL